MTEIEMQMPIVAAPTSGQAVRGRPRSQESEDAILDATMSLLVQDGYAGLTTDRISARARCSKSTIYRRWPTKEHLALAVFDRLPMLVPVHTGRLLEDLVAVALQFVGFLHTTAMGSVLSALVTERLHNADLAAALDPVIRRRREPVKEILQRAVAARLLPAGTDLESAEDLLLGPLLMRMFFVPGDLSEPALREMFAIVLTGLGAHPFPD